MRLLTRRKTPIEELKDAAIEALVNALDDDKHSDKPGLKGVRALAAGAVIYTAGRAAFKGQRFVREQLSSDTEDDQAEDLEDDQAEDLEDEETRPYEEPEGEGYEVDQEEDEPEAVEEHDEEPEAVEEDERRARRGRGHGRRRARRGRPRAVRRRAGGASGRRGL